MNSGAVVEYGPESTSPAGDSVRPTSGSLVSTVEFILGCLIATILTRSALGHLSNPYLFLTAILRYKLTGPGLSLMLAICLPFWQLTVSGCLVLRCAVEPALLSALGLATLFTVAQASALGRGLKIGCGCFGAVDEKPIGAWSVSTALAVGLGAAAALWLRRQVEARAGVVPASRNNSRASFGALTHRRGVTLVETLIVLAILSLLAALLLPAVQAAREAARRTRCANNFRQVGLALQNYHAMVGSFPQAVIWSPAGEPLGAGIYPVGVIDRVARFGDEAADTIYVNWLLALLPFLDQAALAQELDSRLPISHPNQRRIREASLAVLVCPSDPLSMAGRWYQRGSAAGLESNRYARGNVAMNAGPDRNCIEGLGSEDPPCLNGFFVRAPDLLTTNDQTWGRGIGGVNKAFRASDVIDGLSNTVAIDEIRAGEHRADLRGAWALGQVGASVVARHGKYEGIGGPNDWSVNDEIIGCGFVVEQAGGDFSRNPAAHGMACLPVGLGSEINGLAIPRSLHPGGIHVGLCDGAVRMIADTINYDVWQAAHTRNQQESDEFWAP